MQRRNISFAYSIRINRLRNLKLFICLSVDPSSISFVSSNLSYFCYYHRHSFPEIAFYFLHAFLSSINYEPNERYYRIWFDERVILTIRYKLRKQIIRGKNDRKWSCTMKLSGSSVNDAKTVASCVPSRNYTATYPNNVPASIFVSSIVKRTVKKATEKNGESR